MSMSCNRYYLISTKYTYPDSVAFTLWGEKSSGYYWYQQWAGLYTEKYVEIAYPAHAIPHEGVYPVRYDLIRDKFRPALYISDRLIVSLLPNTKEIRELIGLKKSALRGGMSQIKCGDIIWMDELKVVGRWEQ